MKVRIKIVKQLVGPGGARVGEIVERDEEEAKRFFMAGIAIPLPSEKREKAIPKDVTEKRAVHSNKQSRRRTNKPK